MKEGKSDHILVVLQLFIRAQVLHGKELVGILREIDDLIIRVLHLSTARYEFVFCFKDGNRNRRLVTLDLALHSGNPTIVGILDVDMALCLAAICFVVRHDDVWLFGLFTVEK